MDKEMVSLVALQAEDSPLPVEQARQCCHRSIEMLRLRIEACQKQISDWQSLLDRLDAAKAKQKKIDEVRRELEIEASRLVQAGDEQEGRQTPA